MGSILAVILVVAIIYFLYNYFKGTKPRNTPVKAAPQGKTFSVQAKEETTSQEYWQKSKEALNNGEIDDATRLAFQARKKEAESKGYEFTENSSFGNPLLVIIYKEFRIGKIGTATVFLTHLSLLLYHHIHAENNTYHSSRSALS